MRVGIFNDIHGNAHALDAVIAAIGVVDEYWVLGDLAAIGADPVGCVERIRALPNARVIRGNTDRYVYTFERPSMPRDPKDMEDFERSFIWTLDAVERAGHLDWLKSLPLDERLTLPDSTRMLLVHASPGTDDGHGFWEDKPDDATSATMLDGAEAEVVCVAHTHRVVDRTIGGIRVLNAGAVSNQHPGQDKRAHYAILTADANGHEVQQLRVDYDRDAAIAALEASGYPSAAFVKGLLTE